MYAMISACAAEQLCSITRFTPTETTRPSPARQIDGERHARFVVAVNAMRVDGLANPVGQRQLQLHGEHRVSAPSSTNRAGLPCD
jgi:hypothetical protein